MGNVQSKLLSLQTKKHLIMKEILTFLRDLAANNNRPWFQANRSRYDEVRAHYENIVRSLLVRIAQFDPSIAHLDVKDCTYRIYRDTRFSADKSPYKRHLGTFISARGKQSYHAGYYLHLEPAKEDDNGEYGFNGCFAVGGTWYLPSKILKEVRMSILEDTTTFRSIVENAEFRRTFPTVGYELLKTMPKGFPKDFPHPEWLRPKVYSCGHQLSEDFFLSPHWLDDLAHIFQISKPFIDFLNDTIDDYDL